ncbi:hypothetical protein L6452_08243 [Arctium lappa]|uniref:Uncharacterized protein n=1 Tax=Arctium lappa TaxID=4217 RepID=A0ACB9DH12_ARCLA|nr:hypothetical protein L6452_08243 [Arctium lappa]
MDGHNDYDEGAGDEGRHCTVICLIWFVRVDGEDDRRGEHGTPDKDDRKRWERWWDGVITEKRGGIRD